MTRDDILFALQDANVQAFLRVIREGESSQDDSAYTVMFGGGHFESIEDHPRKLNVVGRLKSTAAGAYQFLSRTWDEMARQYGLNDFGSTNQDIAAVGLIHRRKALDAVKAGRIREAIKLCAREWASLPGSPYGQPTITLARALEVYAAHGGQIAPVTPQEVKPMPAPLAIAAFQAFLPALVGLIPKLGAIFGSGSEVAQRNVAAASMVADAVVTATNTPNLQAAIEAMQTDPVVVRDASEAIDAIWPMLTEVGGGIVEARKAAYAPDQVPPWKNPAIWFAAAVIPLVYLVAVAVLFGVGGQSWSDDIKTLFVTAIVTGALGSMTGFFLGSSMGSQKKDTMLGGPR